MYSVNASGGNDTATMLGSNGYVGLLNGTGDTLYEAADNAFNVAGGKDSVIMGDSGDYLGLLSGSGYSVLGNGGTIDTLANTSVNLALSTCAGVAFGFSRIVR